MYRAILTWLVLILAVVAGTSLACAEKRVALVIGNSAYQNVPALLNPANDAQDVAVALKALGFDVIEAHDLNQADMLATVRRFSQAAEGADTGLFFYAGHGLQVGSVNYLVPTDAKLAREGDLAFEAVKLDLVLEQLERETGTALIFLDACRDNPVAQVLARSMGARSASLGRGLARVDSGIGTFIAFSTQPGNIALDGQGRNSPFTAALVKHINDPGKDLSAVMIAVRNDVYAATDGKQVPWENSSLRNQFFFGSNESVVAKTGTPRIAELKSAERKQIAVVDPEKSPRTNAISAYVMPMSGAPGVLARAMKAELSARGIHLTNGPGRNAYKVAGMVGLSESSWRRSHSVNIDWVVSDPSGKRLGSVSQQKDVPYGTVDGWWDTITADAAKGAADGVIKLFLKEAVVTPTTP